VRLKQRGDSAQAELAKIDSHSTEAEVRELRRVADVVVMGDRLVTESRDCVLEEIGRLQATRESR